MAPAGTCGLSTSNSISVSWVDGISDGGQAINSYTVTYEPVGNLNANNRLSQTIFSTGTNTFFGRQFTMVDLAIATDYVIYVTAANDFGSSPASQTFICQTQGTAPAAPAGTCGLSTSHTINVSWVDGLTNGGSAVHTYTITYEPTNSVISNDRRTQTVSVNDGNNFFFGRSDTLENLIPGHEYIVYVSASNDYGTSPMSQSFVCTTLGVAPHVPVGTCGIAADRSITIYWQDQFTGVDFASPAESYIVTYQATNNLLLGNIRTQQINQGDTNSNNFFQRTYTVPDLHMGDSYTFTVQAMN